MGIPVLVIESNVDNAKLIKKSLEADQRFQVTLATRAIEALMRFTETRFRLAVVDFGVPDLNGIELIRQIRGIDESIIVVVILNKGETPPKGLEKYAINLVLYKPSYLSELPQKLPRFFKSTGSLTSPGSPAKPSSVQKQPQREVQERPKSIPRSMTQSKTSPEKITEQKMIQKKISVGDTKPEEIQPQKIAQSETVQTPTGKATQPETIQPPVEKAAQPETIQPPVEKVAQPETIQPPVEKVTKPETIQPPVEKVAQPEIAQSPTEKVVQPKEVQPSVGKAETTKVESTLDQKLGEKAKKEEIASDEKIPEASIAIPPWLKDPNQVEQQMASLVHEHSAYATLLSIGSTSWTYSEKLNENQALGIVRLLSEHDEGLQSKGALIRYIRLGSSGNDFLLYAIPVVGDINLSMIFSMDTPFSVARRQSNKLSRLLIEQDPRKKPDLEEKPSIEEEPDTETTVPVSQEEDEPLLPSEWIPGPQIQTKKEEPAVLPSSSQTAEPSKKELITERVMSPSFTAAPEVTPIPDDWMPKEPRTTSDLPFLERDPAPPKKTVELEPINLAQQEPQYYLPFTAILLPRFPNHRLAGSLANQLENWLRDICVAWGWRVDHIDLRSEFLRFTFSLSPDIAPAQAVQNLANNLSSRILNAFPNLTNDLPSGQFWAKSYLLTAGSDVGKDRLASFIETTRKEQGLVN